MEIKRRGPQFFDNYDVKITRFFTFIENLPKVTTLNKKSVRP